MVISNGGVTGQLTVSLVKRKFDELISANLNLGPTLSKFRRKFEPITFYLEEMSGAPLMLTYPCLFKQE